MRVAVSSAPIVVRMPKPVRPRPDDASSMKFLAMEAVGASDTSATTSTIYTGIKPSTVCQAKIGSSIATRAGNTAFPKSRAL